MPPGRAPPSTPSTPPCADQSRNAGNGANSTTRQSPGTNASRSAYQDFVRIGCHNREVGVRSRNCFRIKETNPMQTGAFFRGTVLAAGVMLLGLSPIVPARAQEEGGTVRARIVVRTPEGDQVFNVDPGELPPLGDGTHRFIMTMGPDGQVM